MFLDVQEAATGSLEFDRTVRIGTLAWQESESVEVDDARIEGQVVAAADGHLLRGRLSTVARLPCARCLESYELAIQTPVLRIYVIEPEPAENGIGEERRLQTDEVPLARYDGRRIDLRSLATEQVYLELPLKPICRDECAGLCAECGGNRNRTTCGCRRDTVDPRLAGLASFLTRS